MHFLSFQANPLSGKQGFRRRISIVTGLALAAIGLIVQEDGRAVAAEPNIPPVLLQMSRDPAIHTELGLSASQAEAVLAVTDQADKVLWPSRIQPLDRQREINDQLTTRLWKELIGILDAEQRQRLVQLQRQALGTRMFLRPEFADELRLSESVREKLKGLAIQTDQDVNAEQKKLTSGGNAAEISKEIEKLKERERKGVVALLTPKQQQQVGMLIGTPFDFSKVKRTNPRAPEFISDSGQWLQGKPLKMKELRGKVVVVHFYAYECINCRRNLPHYNGWASDFSTDDVVIVGIQTPETSRERDPSKVTAALSEEKINYPILFDPENKNWDAWGNTMWPTVYLIDRDGFIRTWWQGELNFNGATGEQQYREFIRQLIDEKTASGF